MNFTYQEIILRLVIAAFLSGIIGLEREVRQKPAGIRTNALIGLGAALMTLSGIYVATYWPQVTDAGRLASMVIQGVGFLGAGAIIQASGSVHGLTTAATMWVVAGIGIASGLGFYFGAFITAIIVLILLMVFGPLDAKLIGSEEEKAKVKHLFQRRSKE